MRFGYTILYVEDVARAIDFYERALGLTRRFLVAGTLEPAGRRGRCDHESRPGARGRCTHPIASIRERRARGADRHATARPPRPAYAQGPPANGADGARVCSAARERRSHGARARRASADGALPASWPARTAWRRNRRPGRSLRNRAGATCAAAGCRVLSMSRALPGARWLHRPAYGKSFRARMIRSTMWDPPLAPFVEAFCQLWSATARGQPSPAHQPKKGPPD